MSLLESVRRLRFTALRGGKDPEKQKEELEKLLIAALPVGEKMLATRGEFLPYGATMDRKGKISNVGGFTGDEQPDSAELIELLKEAFRRDAKAGKLMASALFCDVVTDASGQTARSGAIRVDLDHRDGVSLVMVYPYTISPDGKVQLAAPLATKGQGEIFRAK